MKSTIMAFVILALLFSIPSPHAEAFFAFSDNDAIRSIIGEASNQGYKGMLAVACAIRNRGTLKGVYGLRAKHINSQPKWVWQRARKAWDESKAIDITQGATHWHNVDREGENYWTRKLTKTVKIGQHQFYKERPNESR